MPETLKAQKLGPGSLIIGDTGSTTEFAPRCKSVAIEPETDQEDDEFALDWGTIEGDTTDTANLTGTLWQTYDSTALIKWAHDNHLKVLPFEFIPDAGTGAWKVTGKVQITRIAIGGDAKTRNTSDFEWKIIGGDYDLVEYTPPTGP